MYLLQWAGVLYVMARSLRNNYQAILCWESSHFFILHASISGWLSLLMTKPPPAGIVGWWAQINMYVGGYTYGVSGSTYHYIMALTFFFFFFFFFFISFHFPFLHFHLQLFFHNFFFCFVLFSFAFFPLAFYAKKALAMSLTGDVCKLLHTFMNEWSMVLQAENNLQPGNITQKLVTNGQLKLKP